MRSLIPIRVASVLWLGNGALPSRLKDMSWITSMASALLNPRAFS